MKTLGAHVRFTDGTESYFECDDVKYNDGMVFFLIDKVPDVIAVLQNINTVSFVREQNADQD